jgi:hypothetical protein
MTEGLKANKAINLPEWERQVKAWEADRSLPCPYMLPEQSGLLSMRPLHYTDALTRCDAGVCKEALGNGRSL